MTSVQEPHCPGSPPSGTNLNSTFSDEGPKKPVERHPLSCSNENGPNTIMSDDIDINLGATYQTLHVQQGADPPASF